MPIYRFECKKCGKFEVQLPMEGDYKVAECPVCGGKGERVYTAVRAIFRGEGYYRTDNKEKK